ncbi:protein translocase SEC61 complex subunit gamma [Nanoarchaeota archaeon]
MEEPRLGKIAKLKNFWKESIRVLKITKKPNKEEFKVIVKVSGLGIIVIGLVGFLVAMIKQVLF